MYSNTDPTTMLGRQSQLQTTSGVINGTILAVGAKGISVAVERQVLMIRPCDIQQIAARS